MSPVYYARFLFIFRCNGRGAYAIKQYTLMIITGLAELAAINVLYKRQYMIGNFVSTATTIYRKTGQGH